MRLLDVADMLADVLSEIIEKSSIYAGNINANENSCIGVYASKRSAPHKFAIGGSESTLTREKDVTVLIHHTDNPSLAEKFANDVLDILADVRQYDLPAYMICYLSCSEPIDVGRDDRGICEYVIEMKIYYQYRKDE